MRQVLPQAELQQLVTHELARGQSPTLFVAQLPRPGHELERDHVEIGVLVGGVLGQHMPDHDEQLACDGDDGLVLFHPTTQPLELGFPKVIRLDGMPGRLGQDIAQFFATFLGDVARAVRLSTVMYASSQPTVANQLFGGGKARDVTDGRQHGHGDDESDAGQVQQIRRDQTHRVARRGLGTHPLPRFSP